MNWLQKTATPEYINFIRCGIKLKFSSTIRSPVQVHWLGRLCIADYDEYQDKIELLSKNNPLPFNDWFTGFGGRIYIPFDAGGNSEFDEDVQDMLTDIGCNITDYQGGYCQKGNDVLSISKALEQAKNKELQELQQQNQLGEIYDIQREIDRVEQSFGEVMNIFMNSPLRTSKGVDQFYVVVSQNPHDIAMMSTDRGWTSCMELGSGSNHKDVYCEVEKGGLIAYLISGGDKSIENPLARILIRHYMNRQGQSIAILEDSVYGNDMEGFYETVKEWIDERQNIDPGLYRQQGGQYTDSLHKTELFEPQTPEGVMEWYNGKDPNAQFSTWTVTDEKFNEVATDDPEEWQEEVTFDTREEAQRYIDNRNTDDSWRDYYGDEWTEFNEENGEYAKERFELTENEIDHRKTMKRDAIKSIINSPRGSYPDELIQQIKKDLNFGEPGDYSNRELRRQFAEQFPDLLESNDYYQMGQNDYLAYINGLPEGPEKDQLKQEELSVISSYMNDPMELALGDSELTHGLQQLRMSTDVNTTSRLSDSASMKFNMLFGDKIIKPLQALFKPIPESMTQQIVNFANNIETMGLNNGESPIRRKKKNYDNSLISNIIHMFFMTGTDTPIVQKLYSDLVNSPRFGDNHYGRENYSDINIETIGLSIARLGENGREFIPWAQQKLAEEQAYYKQLAAPGAWNSYSEGYSFKQSKKNIERYLHVIDSLENGTGHSKKYRFF